MTQFSNHKPLLGSVRSVPPGDHLGLVDSDEQVDVTLFLRRKKPLDAIAISSSKNFLTRSQLEAEHGADADDIELVQAFARHFGLLVSSVEAGKRLVRLSGTAQGMSTAFNVELLKRHKNGHVFRARVGPIFMPVELSEVVTGVFGLDRRTQARPHLRYSSNRPSSIFKPDAFDGNQLASVYNFPVSQGAGSAIALIELGGGYLDSDIAAFFSSINLPKPEVISVSVNGGKNSPLLDPGADTEVCLDIEVAGAVAPACSIICYFAPNDDQSFLEAVLAAVHDSVNKPNVMSISWGAAETEWTAQQLVAMSEAFQSAAALGISVFAAAGDNGCNDNANDGLVHIDFPASSPYVTACGGTTLVLDNGVRQESVWNDGDGGATGGGISSYFPRPSYQDSISMPQNLAGPFAGRGVPDLCAVADPNTGYAVRVDNVWQTVGGTSACGPLNAGLVARINSIRNQPSGLINLPLYKSGIAAGFNDIVSGNNSVDGVTGYSAEIGWDAVSGWGSPNGIDLLRILSS